MYGTSSTGARLIGIVRTIVLAVIGITSLALVAPAAIADTGTFTVLHAFTGSPDGASPAQAVSVDSGGNIYGTTLEGGDANCSCGMVFKIARDGAETNLLTFTGPNGSTSYSEPLIDKAENVYGTAFAGGAGVDGGQGTIFKIAPDGTASTLYSFCSSNGCPDGGNPVGGLIEDKKGNLYGLAQEGGTHGYGVVFKLTARGKLKVLFSFDGSNSGGFPVGALVRDRAGNFYGTACCNGAHNGGTIFKLSPKGAETTLYSFDWGTGDAAFPGGLIIDANGNLFGAATGGGQFGYGAIWELPAGGTEKVLYSFQNGSDGAQPSSPLVMDAMGNLYGAAEHGGSGAGTIFMVAPDGTETVLHTLAGNDGTLPVGGLVYRKGVFYGTTFNGGSNSGGTVFSYVK